ncbi:MAG: T9SS type A sorting domain-containing protein, partial [Armatimonadetes bacterium]|nr:T9SS type A sorting domain-containing protein [Armatimonadota bacterium]
YGLHQNYPNPFNPNTEISFMMKNDCIGELAIYNIKGQKTRILFTNKSIPKDELIIYNWNGKDKSGKEVSSGVYYYKLMTTKGNYIRKMILMK